MFAALCMNSKSMGCDQIDINCMQLKERQNLIFQKEKRVLFSTFAKKSLGLCTCVLIIHKKIIQQMSLVTLTVFRNVMVALGWREKNGILQRTWRTFQMLKGTGMLCYERKLVTHVRNQYIFLSVCLSVSWEWHFALVWFGLCVCMGVLGRGGRERDYRQYLTLNQLIKLTALVERARMKTSLRAIGKKRKDFSFLSSSSSLEVL